MYTCRLKVAYKCLFARLSTKFINTRAYWRCIFSTNTFYLQRLQTAQANRNARAFCKRQRERVLTHFAQLPRCVVRTCPPQLQLRTESKRARFHDSLIVLLANCSMTFL